MASDRLFGYSIEDVDGKLVITVDGAYAGKLSEYIRGEMEAGREWRVLSCVTSLDGLTKLGRLARGQRAQSAQYLTPEDVAEGGSELSLDLETIFKQGFSSPAVEFESQLENYRETLEALKVDLASSQTRTSDSAAAASGGAENNPTKNRKKK